MSIDIDIHVPGEPVAKGRARVTMRGTYTPKRTRDWEKRAALAAKAAMQGRPPLTGPVSLSVTAAFSIPVSWPKWKRDLACWGRLRHTIKPDSDNLAKIVQDALNGIVWADDAQVVDLVIRKDYEAPWAGVSPGVSIRVAPVTGQCCKVARQADVRADVRAGAGVDHA